MSMIDRKSGALDSSLSEAVNKQFETLKQQSNFDSFAITHVNSGGTSAKQDYVTSSFTNYPESWINHYKENEFIWNDPVVAFAQRTTVATEWTHLRETKAMTKPQKRVMNEARDFGLISGVFFSARQFSGGIQLISFSSKDSTVFSESEMSAATLIGSKIAVQIAEAQRVETQGALSPLSDRERECLTWAAIGKSSADIELIVGISRNTVDFHIKNAMAKLDATSRTYAIVKAIRLGLIDP